jgi:hypothetical protein
MNAISLRPNGLNGFLKILYAVSCQLWFHQTSLGRLSDFIIKKSNYYHFSPLQLCGIIGS